MSDQLHKHPWFMDSEDPNTSHPKTHEEDTALLEDDKLRMFGFFEVKRENNNPIGAYLLYNVIERDDRALFRLTMSASVNGGFGEGKTTILADYPIADIDTLNSEAREFIEGHFQMSGSGVDPRITLKDKTQPLVLGAIPESMSNEEARRMIVGAAMHGQEQGMGNTIEDHSAHLSALIIAVLLGFVDTDNIPRFSAEELGKRLDEKQKEDKEPEKDMSRATKFLSRKQNTDLAPNSELRKAAEESALISMYGREKMEELAKKMGYKGAIINSDKA